MPESLYDFDQRLRRVIRTVERSDELSARKKSLILKYKDEMLVNGLSTGRAVRLTYYMRQLATWLDCEFEDADIDAIKRVVAKIEASRYVPYSKMEHKMALRKFYKWLRGTEDYPAEVKWIPLRIRMSDKGRLPEELLTEEDVKALIDAAMTPRDRAFVAALYESGARIGELALLKLKHVSFDSYGALIIVNGKTGSRRVRLISAVPYLTTWINAHPQKNDPEAWLWVTNRGGTPRYSTVKTILTRLAKRSGIRKRVNPHSFRHARATRLACHLTEAQMKEYFGWTKASSMAAVYVHLSGRDVDDALLKLYGLKKQETADDATGMKPKACLRCRTDNPCTNKFCSLCGLALDTAAGSEVIQDELERRKDEKLLDRMLQDPEFREHFLMKLQDLKKSR